MTKGCDNSYKICREASGFTQFQAAEFLHISDRTLSAYENGTKVPDEIVALMAKHYNAPVLAYEHLKRNNCLSEFLPEVVMPKTHGDVHLYISISHDEIIEALSKIRLIFAKGRIDDHGWDEFSEVIQLVEIINSKLFSITLYGQQFSESA